MWNFSDTFALHQRQPASCHHVHRASVSGLTLRSLFSALHWNEILGRISSSLTPLFAPRRFATFSFAPGASHVC